MLTDNLRRLFDVLGEHRAPVSDYIKPGRRDAEVRAMLDGVGLQPSQELVEWFGYLDGIDEMRCPRDLVCQMAPGFTPLSLEGAIYSRSVLVDLHTDPSSDLCIPDIADFLPLENGDACHGVMEMLESVSPVHWYDPEEPEHSVTERWSSLEHMLLSWIEKWESGTFMLEENGSVVVD